jgi:hypothetical protein
MNRNHSVISRLDYPLSKRSSTDTVIHLGGEFDNADEHDVRDYNYNRRRRRAEREEAKTRRGLRP